MLIRYLNYKDESYINAEEIEDCDKFIRFIDFICKADRDLIINDTVYGVEDYEYLARTGQNLSALNVYVV